MSKAANQLVEILADGGGPVDGELEQWLYECGYVDHSAYDELDDYQRHLEEQWASREATCENDDNLPF